MTTVHKINSPAWKKLIVTEREEKKNPATIISKNPMELRMIEIEQSLNLILRKLNESTCKCLNNSKTN